MKVLSRLMQGRITKFQPSEIGGIAKFYYYPIGGITKYRTEIFPGSLVPPPPVVNVFSLKCIKMLSANPNFVHDVSELPGCHPQLV